MRTRHFRVFPVLFLLIAGTVFWSSCRTGKRPLNQDLRQTMEQEPHVADDAAPTLESGIRDVDFKNHTFSVDGDSYPFQNGQWSEDQGETAVAQVDSVIYGDLMDSGREQAVVVLSGNWGGGNLESGSVLVFDFHDNQAWEVFSTPGDRADIRAGLLHVSYPEWAEEDPLYSPSLTVSETYRWNGLTFIKENSITGASAK